jgi:enoyl-CoA hydratase/carnithine racemase
VIASQKARIKIRMGRIFIRRLTMPYEEILYAAKGPVGYLTLNNPEKINALSKNMIDAFLNKKTPIWKDRQV